jgi:hypothetical protein
MHYENRNKGSYSLTNQEFCLLLLPLEGLAKFNNLATPRALIILPRIFLATTYEHMKNN